MSSKIELPSLLVERVRDGEGVLVWSWQSIKSAPTLRLKTAKQLPFRLLITTDRDDSLVRVLEEAGRQPLVVTTDADIGRWDETCTTVILLSGLHESKVQDRSSFFRENPRLLEQLRALFAIRAVLLAHWDPRDKSLRRVYRAIVRDLASDRPPVYALKTAPLSHTDHDYWREQNRWQLLDLPGEPKRDAVESFLLSLTAAATMPGAVSRREVPIARQVPGQEEPAVRPSPYKYLNYFEESDEHSFFGRTKEIRSLANLALTHRLSLLLGPSGTGKTSLILAGASPYLRRLGYTPLHVRPGADLLRALENALHLEQGVSAPEPGETSLLADQPEVYLRERLRGEIERAGRTLIVFMDQFEELLTESSEEGRNRSARVLGELVNDRSLDWHLVVSIRQDFMAELHDLSHWIPGLFDYRLRLHGLTRQAARAAIQEPAERSSLHFETQLIDRILDELTRDTQVEPPQLQIVCHRLWQDLQQKGETTFSNSGYDRLGGALAILTDYLSKTLHQMGYQGAAATTILKALVTSEGTKALLSAEEVTQRTRLGPSTVEEVLEALEKEHRLVRCLSLEKGKVYELSHEYLVPEIIGWMDPNERQARQIQDLLQAEVYTWRQWGTFLDKAKLDRIQASIENGYFSPNEDEIDLLLQSAVICGSGLPYWLNQFTPERAVRLFRQDFKEPEAEVRLRSIQAIRILAGLIVPGSTCMEAAQLETKKRVRRKLNGEIVDLAMDASQDAEPQVRLAAIDLLGLYSNETTRRRLVELRRDASEQIRERANHFLDKLNPDLAKNLHLLEQVEPLLTVATLCVGVLVLWAFRTEKLSQELVTWQMIFFAIGLIWVLSASATRLILRTVRFFVYGALLILVASVLVPAARIVVGEPHLLIRVLPDLSLSILKVLGLAGITALSLMALLIALYAAFSLLLFILLDLDSLPEAIAEAWKRCLQTPKRGADAAIRTWRTLSSRASSTTIRIRESCSRIPGQVTSTKALTGTRLVSALSEICKLCLRKAYVTADLVLSAVSSGTLCLIGVAGLVYLYFLVPETHSAIHSSLRSIGSSLEWLIPNIERLWKLLLGLVPGLDRFEQLALLVVVLSLMAGGLRLVFRIASRLLALVLWVSILCLPLILMPSSSRLEIVDRVKTAPAINQVRTIMADIPAWAEALPIEEYWHGTAATVQAGLSSLSIDLAGFEFILLTVPSETALFELMLIICGLIILIMVARAVFENLFSEPLLLLAMSLPVLFLTPPLPRNAEDTWLASEGTLHSWLPELQNWWTGTDSAVLFGTPILKLVVVAIIFALLLTILYGLARILLIPFMALAKPVYSAALLCLIPSIFAWAMGVPLNLFLVSIGMPILLLCVMALRSPAWRNLHEQKPIALRIVGGSLGCMLSLGLATAWSLEPASIPLLPTALNGLLVGAIASAMTLAGLSGVERRADTEHTSLRITLGMVLIGPIVWILVAVMSAWQGRVTYDATDLLSWVYSGLVRFGWINVLLVTLFSCIAARHWLGEYRTAPERLRALFPEVHQRGIWTKLSTVLQWVMDQIASIWHWLKSKTGLVQRGETKAHTRWQRARVRFGVLKARTACLTKKCEQAKSTLHAWHRARSRHTILALNLAIWTVAATAASLAALSGLASLLSSIHVRWGMDGEAISRVGELLVRIKYDPEAIAYAVGLLGGLGITEWFIWRSTHVQINAPLVENYDEGAR